MREKKEINVQIGERVRIAREQAKMTQEQLAESISVSTQYVSDLERGVVGASVQTIKNICESLNTTSDSLIFGTVDVNISTVIMEKCEKLNPKQISHLMNIIDNFIAAVNE